MAKDVSHGYKLLQYNVAENGMLEFIGDIFEKKPGRVKCYPDHFPMREARGPWATAKQLEEDLEKADPGFSGVYVNVAKAITQSKTVDGKEWFKIHWQGYSKSESTWEPVEHLVECPGSKCHGG